MLHLLTTVIGTKLLNARALVCPEELAKADMRPFRRDSAFDPELPIGTQVCCDAQRSSESGDEDWWLAPFSPDDGSEEPPPQRGNNVTYA